MFKFITSSLTQRKYAKTSQQALRHLPAARQGWHRIPACITVWFIAVCALPLTAFATSEDLRGQCYEAPADWQYQRQSDLASTRLTTCTAIRATGGRFWHQADFKITQNDTYVVDFKNSSTIGLFHHFIFDRKGKFIAEMSGGVQSLVENPFFLRHGRDVTLAPGDYRLITEMNSPFFLAQPEPYVDSLSNYQHAIKYGNALTMVCLGVFLSLGFYYAALAVVRRRIAERMYALFIFGNLLYNGTALLVFKDLFYVHWFYLISVPILFSNIAYIIFVKSLLAIRRDNHPRLRMAGRILIGLFLFFIVLAAFRPNWSLELDRYGVGLIMSYGLVTGIIRARQGFPSARLYLLAIIGFFVLGLSAISMNSLDSYTMYVEHIGLLAVTTEVFLLALVLSYQFAQLEMERQSAQDDAERHSLMARTDVLTGLPNRFQLELEISKLPEEGSLSIVDLDGLKHCNDRYGHQRGDELLQCFARHLQALLGTKAMLHRLGGDEFAITSNTGDVRFVAQMVNEAIDATRLENFDIAGASCGAAYVSEYSNSTDLKRVADANMYEQKQEHRRR